MICISILCIVAQVFLDLTLPGYMADITKLVETEGSHVPQILNAGSRMLLCALGSFISAICVIGLSSRIAAGFSKKLRELQFNQVESFSMEEINRFSTASLITRSTNDVTQVQMIIAFGLQALVKAPIMATWAIVKIAGKGVQWTMATAVAVLVLVLMIGIMVTFAVPKFKKVQGLTDNLNRVTRENLTGLAVVRAYNAESYQQEKFEKANTELTDTNQFIYRIMAMMQPGMSAIMSGLSLSIYWIGAFLINAASMADRITLFSNMVVFISYAAQVVMSFMMLSMIFLMLPRASVAAKRILEVIETKPKLVDGQEQTGLQEEKGEIEFKDVSFRYPDASGYALQHVSFAAHKGETVAFIGATGSGKTTLVNLALRFYDPTEGKILVDGKDSRAYTQESLHEKFGYVPQKSVMFSGDISSNVVYGDSRGGNLQQDAMEEAVEVAQAVDFVNAGQGGFERHVAQGGTNLSGGQKQRISMARAIYRDAEIYVFDDALSALDYRTDRLVRTALRDKKQTATMLIVAQRIGTIRNADRIIVLDKGNVVGIGTHEELMKDCAIYQEIALSQLSKEELS